MWYEDGFDEPYVVTVHHQTRTVVRIVARYDEDGVKVTEDGEIADIKPVSYFTKYGFLPNPDGGLYDVGFYALLTPLNESVNTVLNQLLDAGTLEDVVDNKGKVKAGTTVLFQMNRTSKPSTVSTVSNHS